MTDSIYLQLKRRLFDKYYSFLNEMQRKSVYTVNGPLLILAGAGSGKTTVLVNRITHILRYGNAYNSDYVPENAEAEIAVMNDADKLSREELGDFLEHFAVDVPPAWSVVAITFTNKAANEIKARLASALGEDSTAARDICAGTFHSVCLRLLRVYGEAAGIPKDPGICDTDDAKKLITDCMKKLNVDPQNLPVKGVMNAISCAKDKLIGPDEYAKSTGGDYKTGLISKIYSMYDARLKESNLLDFDDIIMTTVKMLQNSTEVREKLQKRFRYVCVDEFQDTNAAQLELTKLLSGGYNNVMVVGDDDQSIYKFRGATIENILQFDSMFRDVKVIKLEQNYRSTKTILDAANGVISKNEGRRGKNLWCDGDKGDPIRIVKLETQMDEARFICDSVTEMRRTDNLSFKDFAVLYRTNSQSRALEQAMAKGGIPYRLLGGQRFFDRMEIRDMIAYLAVINNPLDTVHLRRIINTPKRGIGDASIEKAEMIASTEGISMLELMRSASRYPALTSAAGKMQKFVEMIDSLRESAFEMLPSALIKKVSEVTGYIDMLVKAGPSESDRIDNIGELVSTASTYEETTDTPSLSEFLEDVALVSDVDKYDENADAVVLMTIHSAKGLEFPVVFLPGMEDQIFPGYQSIGSDEDIEEERRLAYVAITRAKKKLIMLHTHERMLNGSTQYNELSRFAGEIPPWLVRHEDKTALRSSAVSSYSSKYQGFKSASQGSYGTPKYSGTSAKTPSARKSGSIYSSASSAKPKTAPAIETMKAGDRVRHSTFGAGTVLSAKPMGSDILYEINFDIVGEKKLMGNYARLTREQDD